MFHYINLLVYNIITFNIPRRILNKFYKLCFILNLRSYKIHYGKIVISGGIPSLRILKGGSLVLKGDLFINSFDRGVSWYSKTNIFLGETASLIFGNNVGLNGCSIYCVDHIFIGDNVKIGGGTRIFDTDFHNINYKGRRDPVTDVINANRASVIICSDVFIGTSCIIVKGVTIGERSIIAAGSVVVKSVPSDELWGGCPAKFIRSIIND